MSFMSYTTPGCATGESERPRMRSVDSRERVGASAQTVDTHPAQIGGRMRDGRMSTDTAGPAVKLPDRAGLFPLFTPFPVRTDSYAGLSGRRAHPRATRVLRPSFVRSLVMLARPEAPYHLLSRED